MSLYGTGRSEGIGATLLVAALVLGVQVLAAAFGGRPIDADALQPALQPALGGMLCYRFLRANRRSRYAAFLSGAAYGLSPWCLSLADAPREQFALALAPLALEAAIRCDRPDQRDLWLPWAWVCLALPFAGGITAVAVAASLLAAVGMLRTALCGDQHAVLPAWSALGRTIGLAALAAGNLAWLDPLAPWLGAASAPAGAPPADAAALLCVPGPALLVFALLGILRRQQHVDALAWSALAAAGAAPTLLAAIPGPGGTAPPWFAAPALQTAGCWCTLLALCVLGGAGLDDFLDLPLRRRTALPWLCAGAIAAAPLLPVFAARAPERLWPFLAGLLGLPFLLVSWRRLGMPGLKTWLAAATLVVLAIPALQDSVADGGAPAAPAGEPAPGPASRHPLLHYAALSLALLLAGFASWSAIRRRQKARPAPSAARAAIKKKPAPRQRS
jgi:hypothetical protein